MVVRFFGENHKSGLYKLDYYHHSAVALTGTNLDNSGVTAVTLCILRCDIIEKFLAHIHLFERRHQPDRRVQRLKIRKRLAAQVDQLAVRLIHMIADPDLVAGLAIAEIRDQLCQLLLVDEEMLSSHLRSFDRYGPIVQMGKPRFSEGMPLWTQWLISLGS